MSENVMETLVIRVESDTKTAENGLEKLNKTLSKFKTASKIASDGTGSISDGISEKSSGLRKYISLFRSAADVMGSWFKESNDYVEAVNLFTVAMDGAADSAVGYANRVQDALGIDLKEWYSYVGSFNSLTKGYGIATSEAATMSQNLTQLAYDLGSLWNVDTEQAFHKLQSAMSGQIKGLKVWGVNVSVAQLRETALAHGITLSTAKMTEAQKATLRYVTIMEKTKDVQGDLARTINTPANALRILNQQWVQCKRAMGQVISVVAVGVIPWFQALVSIITDIAKGLAKLFKYEPPKIEYGDLMGNNVEVADDFDDKLKDCTKQAKKLKDSLLGIDELNVISNSTSAMPSTGTGGIGGNGYDPTLGLDLSKYDYNFLAGLEKKDLEQYKNTILDILTIATAVGTVFATWKISTKLVGAFTKLKELIGGFSAGAGILGLTQFFDDLQWLRTYIADFVKDPSWDNAEGIFASMTGIVGDCFLAVGKLKPGGVIKVAEGLTLLHKSIKSICDDGLNWKNGTEFVRGLSLMTFGIGIVAGNFKMAGIGMMVQGFTTLVQAFVDLSKGKDVELSTVLTSIGTVTVGVLLYFGAFDKLKTLVGGASKTVATVDTVSSATETMSSSTGKLFGSLKGVAKNLGFGLLIIAEVALAAGVIIGAIWGIGLLLDQVGKAWVPVMNNGTTVAIAMGIGLGVLLLVGVATALLGTLGSALVAPLALGIAVLALIGVAALLFITEIVLVAKGLVQVAEAWSPVLRNGKAVISGIATGTALLIGIGGACAVLGVASVASVGLLPLAIKLGSDMLVNLSGATVTFVENMAKVGNALGNRLAPSLSNLNSKLPELTVHLTRFVVFMELFALEMVVYAESSLVAGIASAVSTIIGFFTKDPIKQLANDVGNVSSQTKNLNGKLKTANSEFKTAVSLLNNYQGYLKQLAKIANGSPMEIGEALKINLRKVGQNIVLGFKDGVKNKYAVAQNVMRNWGVDSVKWFTSKSYGGVSESVFKGIGKDITVAFKNGISSNYNSTKGGVQTWGTNVKTWFKTKVSYDVFKGIGGDVVKGFNKGIKLEKPTTKALMGDWGEETIKAFRKALDSHSPSRVFKGIGKDTILGYNLGVKSLYGSTGLLMQEWADTFTNVAPTLSLDVDNSALKYYESGSFAKDVSADVTSNRTYAVTGFKESMEQFYKEYLEPTMKEMADDVRRQADKEEQTVVQIGSRTITDVVTKQQKANGYSFAR